MSTFKIPETDMAPERRQLLADARFLLKGVKDKDKRLLIKRLVAAAEACPSISCAFCEHMPRGAANVGEAEAG